MTTSLEIEIRQRLTHYLAGEASLQGFQTWLASATWNIHQDEPQTTQDLAYEIELRLAEFTSGHWEEPHLQELLKPLVTRYSVAIGPAIEGGVPHTESSLSLVTPGVTYQPEFVGRLPEPVSA